jgi:hypothetical protein
MPIHSMLDTAMLVALRKAANVAIDNVRQFGALSEGVMCPVTTKKPTCGHEFSRAGDRSSTNHLRIQLNVLGIAR